MDRHIAAMLFWAHQPLQGVLTAQRNGKTNDYVISLVNFGKFRARERLPPLLLTLISETINSASFAPPTISMVPKVTL